MIQTQLKRVINLGVLNVVRTPFVTFSAIFVMTITLFVLGITLIFGQVINGAVDSLRDRVDITVYFVPETPEEQISELRDKLIDKSYITEVIYVSQLEALEEYRTRHQNDPELLQGLEVLQDNPFRGRFSIRAKNAEDFEVISRFIQDEDILSDNERTIVDTIDFYKNREVILRLSSIVDTATLFSRLIIILFTFLSFLIVFNIIRLVIYLSKDEISVMKLIGANDMYIRAPFLVSGGIYGLIGSIMAIILMYPVSVWVSPYSEKFFGTQGFLTYFIADFFFITAILVVLGVLIGVVSSWLSTKRYLE